jgi:hypothetical protein
VIPAAMRVLEWEVRLLHRQKARAALRNDRQLQVCPAGVFLTGELPVKKTQKKIQFH